MTDDTTLSQVHLTAIKNLGNVAASMVSGNKLTLPYDVEIDGELKTKNINVYGNIGLNDNKIRFRTITDDNHYITYDSGTDGPIITGHGNGLKVKKDLKVDTGNINGIFVGYNGDITTDGNIKTDGEFFKGNNKVMIHNRYYKMKRHNDNKWFAPRHCGDGKCSGDKQLYNLYDNSQSANEKGTYFYT